MPVLLVAATGGHLAQLDRLAERIPGVDSSAVWVTFDSPQSRSLLRGRPHVFVPYTAPRDFRTAIRNMRLASDIIGRTEPTLVASTGNAIAMSFLPVARLAGVPAAYIESAARADGPSLTGRMMRRVPGVQLFTQYREWESSAWKYVGSVFDNFATAQRAEPTPIRRVFVTLGTMTFDFRRLVERVLEILPVDCEVSWQVGSTNVSGLGIEVQTSMSSHAVNAEMRRADVVIAHAGIGAALAAMEAGRYPVLVPRESSHHEHVDDHQQQIAARLSYLGLATAKSVTDLTGHDLAAAARRVVLERDALPLLAIAA
jgi:UDP-N-acetylglucosamine transferase subunit ALG13